MRHDAHANTRFRPARDRKYLRDARSGSQYATGKLPRMRDCENTGRRFEGGSELHDVKRHLWIGVAPSIAPVERA